MRLKGSPLRESHERSCRSSHLRVVLKISAISETCFWTALTMLPPWVVLREAQGEGRVCLCVFRAGSKVKGVAVGAVR